MLPYLSKQAPWFSFLVHIRDVGDMYALGELRFLLERTEDERDLRARLCTLPPFVAGNVQFGFSPVHGQLINIMRMPEQMSGAAGIRAVMEAADVALGRGVRVIGLGALTAPATGGGLRLVSRLPAGITVTTGNAYTAAVARHNVAEAAQALRLDRPARVAVLGCTGSVGGAACQLIAEDGFELLLIGRSAERARRAFGRLAGHVSFHGDLDVLRDADVILVLTSDPTAHVRPEMARSGAVIIDLAQPANILAAETPAFLERNIRVVEGGLVRIPGYSCTYDLRLPHPKSTFACLAETYLFAREGIREHSVGRTSAAAAQRMELVARRHGVYPESLYLDRERITEGNSSD